MININIKTNINPAIQAYVEATILPQYQAFDKAHDPAHAAKVIANSLAIAADHDVDINMVYVIAAYHDIGLHQGRQNHEKNSAIALLADTTLPAWFAPEQIAIMAQAVEDHRASNSHPPRTIYGSIVSEADRDIEPTTILTRTVQYSLQSYPDYTRQEHYRRCMEHIREKYGVGGYLKLWLETKQNRQNLQQLQALLANEEQLAAQFDQIFRAEQEKECP